MISFYLGGGYKTHKGTLAFARELGISVTEAAHMIIGIYCYAATVTVRDNIEDIDRAPLVKAVGWHGNPSSLFWAMIYAGMIYYKRNGKIYRLVNWQTFLNNPAVVQNDQEKRAAP